MRNVFLRAQQMTAEISGEKVVCRGVVHRLKEDKTALLELLRSASAGLEKEEKDDGNGA